MIRALTTACVFAVAASGLEGQVGRGGDPRSQLQLEAATLESRGDLDGAEDALRRLLALEPQSSGAIFALERVLRAKGELAERRAVVREFVERSDSPEVMALNLSLLAEADSVEAMVAAAERWLTTTRVQPAAYRTVAAAYGRSLGPDRALEVLRRGRSALGARDALALEIGDALLASGDIDGAVDEWALAVGDGAATEPVVERLDGLGDRAQGAARRLVRALDESGRRGPALTIAIELALEEEAFDLALREADDLEGRNRVAYLEAIAARARNARLAQMAARLYQEIGGNTADPEDRREVERRIVLAAIEAGDHRMALEAQRRLVASYSRSSEDGRRAQAEAIRLEARAEPDRVLESWREFRRIFPDAPELDEVGAAVAASLQARGDVDGATAVLEGIEGPRSTLERAYLLLGRGDVEEGRQALLAAVSGLPAVEATSVIQLGALLGRLSQAGTEALIAASVGEHQGSGAAASARLAEQASSLPEADRAPVLAEAARIAERSGEPERAAVIRERLLADHPDAPEVAEASLALARHVASADGDTEEAIRLLEDLITNRPNAAVVPEARLELERLRSRGL